MPFSEALLLLCAALAVVVTQAFRRTPSTILFSTEEQQQHRAKHRQLAHDPVVVPVPTDPDAHRVSDLPLLDSSELNGISHWAGHLPILEGDKYLFYWLFAPEEVADDTPLIIWLNGGPACSSMDGLFLENGPIQWQNVNGEYRLVANPHSWHKAPAYTLYIDQPVGTGLSFTTSATYPRNDAEVNADFYKFLMRFFALHADKFVTGQSVKRPVYFSGESHAGHYIPSMMNYILQRNGEIGGTDSPNVIVPLAGAAIGNGWVDPYHQYAAARAAYGHGIIDLAQVYKFQAKEKQCQQQLNQGHYTAGVCYGLLDDIVDQSYGASSAYKVSQYDVRRSEPKKGENNFPPNHKVTEAYLGGWTLPVGDPGKIDPELSTQVLEAIHASAATKAGQKYLECTDPPYMALAHQDGLGVVDDVVAILQHSSQPRLLFFNGVEDLICNHVGNEETLNHLPWEHQNEWMTAKRYAWVAGQPTIENPAAGYIREYKNLMYLKLFAAGHMVPLDQPAVALEMMRQLVQRKSFDSSQQKLANSVSPPDASSCPACPSCEDCPVCPSDDPDNSHPPNQRPAVTESSSDGDIMDWIGPVLAVGGFVALVWSCLPNRRRGKAKIRRSRGDLNGDRSLELNERQSSYQDDFDLDDDKEIL